MIETYRLIVDQQRAWAYQQGIRYGWLNMGIPVLAYEGNMADKREVYEPKFLARIDFFTESLSL